MNPIEQLKSVLCDPFGKCCIVGSDEDRAVVDRALQALAEQPAQYFDEVMYDGSSTAEALKRFQENVRPTSLPDAFEKLMRESDKPTQVPEQIEKYAAALVAGTHEITNLTIRPKRTWVGLTHEEIMDSWDEIRDGDWAPDFYAVIEARLKELNT